MSEVLTKTLLAPDVVTDVAPGFSPACAALKGGATTEVIAKAALRNLAKQWIGQAKIVVGPVQTKPGLLFLCAAHIR